MKRITAAALSLIAGLATLAIAPTDAEASNYSLWICGRNCNKTAGTYSDFGYWGSSSTAAGVNKVAVNWDGSSSVSSSNSAIRNALDCYCTGSNYCYIAAHSAGDLQLGYSLAQYGTSTRSVKTPGTGSGGVCNSTGATQAGWNIKWVDVASGAGGGSELANAQFWNNVGLDNDLKTGNARALYNHNSTTSKYFYMFAGANGTAYSGTLPGQDDEAVAYHSTGGVSTTGSWCNPGDLMCDGVLNTGTTATSNGYAKWSYHTVSLMDTSEAYNHYTNSAWAGIVGPTRSDMVSYAL